MKNCIASCAILALVAAFSLPQSIVADFHAGGKPDCDTNVGSISCTEVNVDPDGDGPLTDPDGACPKFFRACNTGNVLNAVGTCTDNAGAESAACKADARCVNEKHASFDKCCNKP